MRAHIPAPGRAMGFVIVKEIAGLELQLFSGRLKENNNVRK
jgi:hypothetical protein